MIRGFDTHAHLDFPEFAADRPWLLQELATKKIGVINVATDQASIEAVDRLSRTWPLVWGVIGAHPSELNRSSLTKIPGWLKEWERYLRDNPKLVGLGEIGLDYGESSEGSRQVAQIQKSALRQFLTFALEHNLPVTFHCRQAYGDLKTILAAYPGLKGVVHCFSGSLEQAETFLDLGLHLSFTANLTYPKNEQLRDLIKALPMAGLLLETDSPFLPPQSRRGARNDPRAILELAEAIAELKNLTAKEVLQMTTENAMRLFKIDGRV